MPGARHGDETVTDDPQAAGDRNAAPAGVFRRGAFGAAARTAPSARARTRPAQTRPVPGTVTEV